VRGFATAAGAGGLIAAAAPLALTLGIVSGLLNFIPNFGPVLAAIPAALLALMQSPMLAVYVLLFYAVYQAVDGYVLTPIVEGRMVEIPPALILAAQVLFGILLGVFGLLLAMPITAAAFIFIKIAYVEGVLGDDGTSPVEES